MAGLAGAFLTALVGILFVSNPQDGFFSHLSFDVPHYAQSRVPVSDVMLIKMDDASFLDPELNVPKGQAWPRALHARLLEKLIQDGAKLVVFDTWFDKTNQPAEDQALAAAIRRAAGKVVLAAERKPVSSGAAPEYVTIPPADLFRTAAGEQRWGISHAFRDKDGVIREQRPGQTNVEPNLAWAAAEAAGTPVAQSATARLRRRWIHYYGPAGTLPEWSYHRALNAPAGTFQDQYVFIGNGVMMGSPGDELKDHFPTPHTRWNAGRMLGVEILATQFLNLVRGQGEWIRRFSWQSELLLVALIGLIAGFGLSLPRPAPSAAWAAGLMLLATGIGLACFWQGRVWFEWTVIAWLQIPAAWAAGAVLYARDLSRENLKMTQQLETARKLHELTTPRLNDTLRLPEPLANAHERPTEMEDSSRPSIRDFDLLKLIGEGSFGQVWLARSMTHEYRAIKVIYRKRFPDESPFRKEFRGVLRFSPISRGHTGWVHILHVGNEAAAGFFYYVMEAADDMSTGQKIDPKDYAPKTLGNVLADRGALPIPECIRLGISLADSLGRLHKLGLIHRDIKPSNIIFVHDIPKIADIGLVIQKGESKSIAGTEGFMPEHISHDELDDIFSLGRVMYQAATGAHPARHPGFPTEITGRPDRKELFKLIDVINTACHASARHRFRSALDFKAALEKLAAG